MTPRRSAEHIPKALFETDPLNTCCKKNDCFDEYDLVADAIEERLGGGENLDQALIAEISEWFYNGEDFDTGRLASVIDLLREGS